jgi:hypothetical protein
LPAWPADSSLRAALDPWAGGDERAILNKSAIFELRTIRAK